MAARQSEATIVAAFLHDVGHLLSSDPTEDGGEVVEDRHHEVVGARFLANWFDTSVTAPIALHVASKRYLCAVEPSYRATLSAASIRSLELQGGPMTAAEVAEFELHPEVEAAVALRRWDDLGKEPGAPTPTLATFRNMFAELVVRER
jgi:gamma-butyrobetaine dioxygenase